jgi:23S rRNA (cytidine2498-2'-O)-methyltransferase
MRGHKKGSRRLSAHHAKPVVSRAPLPARATAPHLPAQTQLPRVGRMLWTCRAGFEAALYEELVWAGAMPALLGLALVEADPKPGPVPAFGRFGFHVLQLPRGVPAPEAAAGRLRDAARGLPLCVQAWALDTPRAQPASGDAHALGEAVRAVLRDTVESWVAHERGGVLGQLCFLAPGVVVLGVIAAREATSLAAGGRSRMHRGPDAPSRAALKLDEALDRLNIQPGRGELCVDLGAAPGGWTQRLLARGARVIAVDPARLAPALRSHPKVRHVQESAFRYLPEAPADWLFCDMAWRPLEVAQLLAKWGRQGLATQLVANLKLPMKDKNAVLFRARSILEHEGRWRNVAIRQLYHDRDEVTVTATLRG